MHTLTHNLPYSESKVYTDTQSALFRIESNQGIHLPTIKSKMRYKDQKKRLHNQWFSEIILFQRVSNPFLHCFWNYTTERISKGFKPLSSLVSEIILQRISNQWFSEIILFQRVSNPFLHWFLKLYYRGFQTTFFNGFLKLYHSLYTHNQRCVTNFIPTIKDALQRLKKRLHNLWFSEVIFRGFQTTFFTTTEDFKPFSSMFSEIIPLCLVSNHSQMWDYTTSFGFKPLSYVRKGLKNVIKVPLVSNHSHMWEKV